MLNVMKILRLVLAVAVLAFIIERAYRVSGGLSVAVDSDNWVFWVAIGLMFAGILLFEMAAAPKSWRGLLLICVGLIIFRIGEYHEEHEAPSFRSLHSSLKTLVR
jgi:hypothetical protein